MVEMSGLPTLSSLLPDVLAALCDHFSQVECKVEPCPNLSLPPHNLSLSTPGTIHAVSEGTDPSSVLVGSKRLALVDGWSVIATESSPAALSLQIALEQQPTAPAVDWHALLKVRFKRLLPEDADFLVVEVVEGRSRFHLLQRGRGPLAIASTNTILWLVPVEKVHPSDLPAKSPLPEEKKVVKKKIVKRVVKKKVVTAGEGAGMPESRKASSSPMPPNGADSERRRSSAKESSPEVVQEVIEDLSSVAYLVKLGLSPAEDGVSLKDLHGPVACNGLSSLNGSANGANGISNGTKASTIGASPNGIANGNANGLNGHIIDGLLPDSKMNGHSDLLPSKTNGAVDEFPLQGSILGTARKFDATVNGTPPPKDMDESSEDKSVVSSVSETMSSTISEISQNGANDLPPKCPFSPVIKINDSPSSDDDNSFCSVRSRSNERSSLPPLPRPTPTKPTLTGVSPATTPTPPSSSCALPPASSSVLSGFLSSVASGVVSGLGFSRGTSPASSRLSSAGTLTPMGSDHNIAGRVTGLRHSDSSEWSLRSANNSCSTLADRLGRRRSSSSLRTTGASVPRRFSPVHEHVQVPTVRGMPQMPVVALQEVLKILPYRELGEFRRVHPHWDELCGQLLNSGYYRLINRADVLLQDCQRRVHKEKWLQTAITALTNLQVHVLNPVDMMRAPMDEGVLCFPYGHLLDKSFDLLDRIQLVVDGKEDPETAVLPWQRLAEMARRAQVHYRRFVEPEVEKRMSEVTRLQAAARLQRIDSFLVETTVNKLERDTEQARHDLQWEIEQLKQQNTQLKKDNRELKQSQSRLEGRIEALERKFKTVARLLQ